MGKIWRYNPSRTVLEQVVKWSNDWSLAETISQLEERIKARLSSGHRWSRKDGFMTLSDVHNVPVKAGIHRPRRSQQTPVRSPELGRRAPVDVLQSSSSLSSSSRLCGDGENYMKYSTDGIARIARHRRRPPLRLRTAVQKRVATGKFVPGRGMAVCSFLPSRRASTTASAVACQRKGLLQMRTG
jgi:hypothetical protein